MYNITSTARTANTHPSAYYITVYLLNTIKFALKYSEVDKRLNFTDGRRNVYPPLDHCKLCAIHRETHEVYVKLN
jgi:hypothetical protein